MMRLCRAVSDRSGCGGLTLKIELDIRHVRVVLAVDENVELREKVAHPVLVCVCSGCSGGGSSGVPW